MKETAFSNIYFFGVCKIHDQSTLSLKPNIPFLKPEIIFFPRHIPISS